jgi:V8-like Glu-specific endopeptidase
MDVYDDTAADRAPAHREPAEEPVPAREAARAPEAERVPAAPVTLLDVPIDAGIEPRIVRENGRLRVLADVGPDGLDVERRFPPAALTELSPSDVEDVPGLAGLAGYRPPGVATTLAAAPAPPLHGSSAEVIFGADDRRVFQDTSFPWRTTGRVDTAVGFGTGTMIGRRHVLTASHVINWSRDALGNIGWVSFTPGYFDGRGPWGEQAVTEVLRWVENPGTMSQRQIAFDYAVLVLRDPIGDTIGFAGTRDYEVAWNGKAFWGVIGYPQELTGGRRPVWQTNAAISSRQDFTTTVGGSELTGAVLGHFNDITPGQSGGPIWGWLDGEDVPRVVGVVSTIGSTAVRQPDGTTANDNEFGGGAAFVRLVNWARENRP